MQVKDVEGVREITLSHPGTRNSLSVDMMSALHESLLKDSDNVDLRCIVLTAEGKVWSAGHNLKELNTDDNALQASVFQKLTDIVLDVRKLPVPVIAKVNGLAAAAGCQLAASCDIIVATDKSQFSTPGYVCITINFILIASLASLTFPLTAPVSEYSAIHRALRLLASCHVRRRPICLSPGCPSVPRRLILPAWLRRWCRKRILTRKLRKLRMSLRPRAAL